jgi:DNA-binding NarL/FixJ family response regulator
VLEKKTEMGGISAQPRGVIDGVDVETATIRVSIIEDQSLTRETLKTLLDESESCRTAGVFGRMEEALARIGWDLPDVVLVDLGMPGISGIQGISILRERYPSLLMLVLTVYDDDENIFSAICAGANGYLLKKTPFGRLVESIQELISGGAPMSPQVARRVMRLFREVRPPQRADYELTPYEVRLLKLLAEGHTYKTAAAELRVSTHAVSFHLRHIYDKLHVHSKSEAVGKAMRDGLVRLPGCTLSQSYIHM